MNPTRAAGAAGCRIVLGDLDYVADPGLIRRHYGDPWSSWESQAYRVFRTAREAGHPYVSLYARARGMTEHELLPRLLEVAADFPGTGVLLHYFDSAAVAAALSTHGAVAAAQQLIVNYVSGESWMRPRIEALTSIGRPRLVVQPVDDRGLPGSAGERLRIAEQVHSWCAPHGLERSDLYVDALVAPAVTLPFALEASSESVRLLRRHGFSTVAWPANAGLGHPEGRAVACASASRLVHAGLDLAVVATRDDALIRSVVDPVLV